MAGMWSSVVGGAGAEVPGARHKHAMCVDHPHVYLLGGRHGNLPLKDFWTYDLGEPFFGSGVEKTHTDIHTHTLGFFR